MVADSPQAWVSKLGRRGPQNPAVERTETAKGAVPAAHLMSVGRLSME